MHRQHRKILSTTTVMLFLVGFATGCQSPYRADRGAFVGGILGAVPGAIIGDQLGNAGAGAAIGAGVGALGGAAFGSELDKIEAQNRAMIAAKLGREVPPGRVSFDDVITMTRAGVDDELIVNHIRAHGMISPPGTSDLIRLKENNVNTVVIKAMQEPPRAKASGPIVVRETVPPPVIVEEYHYVPPVLWGPSCGPRPYYHRRPRSHFNWGFTFHN